MSGERLSLRAAQAFFPLACRINNNEKKGEWLPPIKNRLYIFLPASTELDCRLSSNAGRGLSDRGGAQRVKRRVKYRSPSELRCPSCPGWVPRPPRPRRGPPVAPTLPIRLLPTGRFLGPRRRPNTQVKIFLRCFDGQRDAEGRGTGGARPLPRSGKPWSVPSHHALAAGRVQLLYTDAARQRSLDQSAAVLLGWWLQSWLMQCSQRNGGRWESEVGRSAPEPSIVHKTHELLSKLDLLLTVSDVNVRL